VIAWLLVSLVLANPVDVVPGIQLEPGVQARLPDIQTVFQLPEEWSGGMPADAQVLLLGSGLTPGMVIVKTFPRLRKGALKRSLLRTQPFDDKVMLIPATLPTDIDGDIWSEFSTNDEGLAGIAVYRLGDDGRALGMLAVGPVDQVELYRLLLLDMSRSVEFE
jgi:hypothetical protein